MYFDNVDYKCEGCGRKFSSMFKLKAHRGVCNKIW